MLGGTGQYQANERVTSEALSFYYIYYSDIIISYEKYLFYKYH